jgi:hypothetical protein
MQNKNNNTLSLRSTHSRYIVSYENVYDALDIYERSVYQALRYDADFSKQTAPVEMSIPDLCAKSKVKRRKVFHALNALEKKYFLIRRTNWENNKFGEVNCYEVAHYLNYFKPVEIITNEPPKNEEEPVCKKDCAHNISEDINGSYIEGVHQVHGVVHQVHGVGENAHAKKTEISQDKFPFETFWKLYPVKKNKKRSLQIWRSHNLDKIAVQIQEKLVQQIAHDEDWIRGYIPHASTYLNGERWNDEIRKGSKELKSTPKIPSQPAPIVLYSQFVGELKLMKQINEISDSFLIPNYEEWLEKGSIPDAKIYIKTIQL